MISCNIPFQKKSFFEPSREVPLWDVFSFFAVYFSTKIVPFLFVKLFVFLLVIFQEKSFFFSFFLYFFQISFIAGMSIRV